MKHPGVLQGEHWLLVYEARQQKWLVSPTVTNDPAFAGMAKAGVSFYDRAQNQPHVPVAAASMPGGGLPEYYS